MQEALSLRELFARYELKRLRGKSQSCRTHFYTAINHYEQFLQREPTTDDLFDDRVSAYMWALIERRGIVADTARSYVKKILALWRFANRQRLCDTWPEVEPVACVVREPLCWSRDELRVLFPALCSQEGNIGPAPASLFWPSLLLTFWDSAERLEAVLMLPVAEVNLVSRWAVCKAESRKGKLCDRGFELHAQTVAFLGKLLESGPRRRLLFECPFGYQTLRLRYKAILADAGLPHDRKHLFHCTRKTVASYFEATGYDATELLGHSTRAVTKAYLAPQIVRRPQPAGVLFRPGE